MLENKKILITGAAGFIGSHLTQTLLNNNNFVILVDNFNNYYRGKEENAAEITKGYEKSREYELIRGDLLDKSIFKLINTQIDVIYHLAAQAGVRHSLQHPVDVSRNNILSTVNILEFASSLQNLSKFIYASSSSIYGNPIYTPCDENHPKNPISPYAVSKLTGEIYVDYYYREYNVPATSLRFYTVYGPRGRPDMAIYKFFNLMFQDKEIPVYGDGKQLRDFTYISDIISGLILAAEKKKSTGEVFNLGYSNPISVNELVDKMYNISKKPQKITYIQKQKGDVDITHSDIRKAEKVLNYHPKISINNGLKYQYEWQSRFFKKSIPS